MSRSEFGLVAGGVPVPLGAVPGLGASVCARPGADHVAAAAIKAALKATRNRRPSDERMMQGIAASFEGDSGQP